MNTKMGINASVLFDKIPLGDGTFVGRATLNSAETLNALSFEMIEALYPKLLEWETDFQIRAVFLEGSGPKAFCAGGDIKKLYASIVAWKQSDRSTPNTFAEKFFEHEYRLDYKIHTYEKPLIVWGHGIVMGGGLGLMAGASLRIVTESTKMAMPEISIGLYPDVGASYFLNRMPEGVGLYLGLTGTRLNYMDTLFVGLGDVYMPSHQKDHFLNSLKTLRWSHTHAENKKHIKELAQGLSLSDNTPSPIKEHLGTLQELTNFQSIGELHAAWSIYVKTATSPWIKSGLETFLKGSPTSAAVIFTQLQRAKTLSLKECFLMEYNMTVQFSYNADFPEGVRALLIDKDNNAQWEPKNINEVSKKAVESYFTQHKAPHPLQHI